MTPRLFVQDAAAADIESAAVWYETRRAGLGGEFLRAVRATLAAIARNPNQYRVVRAEVRRAVVRRFPYNVFFVVDADHTAVLACLHFRRDPQVWQSRSGG